MTSLYSASAGPWMIEAEGLAKIFTGRRGTVEAVRGVDLQVATGEIVGFLGPNGAGKTTTLRMLTTLIQPTAGRAVVAGHDLRTDPNGVRAAIGYVAQGGSAGSDARVVDELVYQAQFYGVAHVEAQNRADALLTQLDLSGLGGRDVKTLSGGQRRRLDIALGLVHTPPLVFLDEPTTGLDPQSRSNMWDHIRRLRDDAGSTVFLTTHYLDEADALCDRILVIDAGLIVAQGSPDLLKSQVSGDLVVLTVDGDPVAAAAVARRIPGADAVVVAGRTVSFRVREADRHAIPLLRELDAAGVVLQGISIKRPTLDDVFLTMTGRTLREEAA